MDESSGAESDPWSVPDLTGKYLPTPALVSPISLHIVWHAYRMDGVGLSCLINGGKARKGRVYRDPFSNLSP